MCFKTKLQTLLGFHQFFPLIFCFRNKSKLQKCIQFSGFLSLLWSVSFSVLSCLSWHWLSRVLVRLSCKMSHTLSSSDIFLMIRRELWDFEKNIRSEVLFSCNFVFILCDICWVYCIYGFHVLPSILDNWMGEEILYQFQAQAPGVIICLYLPVLC